MLIYMSLICMHAPIQEHALSCLYFAFPASGGSKCFCYLAVCTRKLICHISSSSYVQVLVEKGRAYIGRYF